MSPHIAHRSTLKKMKNGEKLIRRTLKIAKPYLWLLIFALIFAVLQISATLLAPVIVGRAIDYMVGANDVNFSRIARAAVWLGGCIVVAALAQWLCSLFTNQVAYKTVRDIRNLAIEKINSVPLKTLDTLSHGDILNRVIVNTEQISDGLIHGFTQIFSGVITVAITLIFMLSLSVTVSVVVIIVTPLSIAVAYIIARSTHKMFKKQSEKRSELSGLVEEMLSGQKVVKAFGYESRAEEKFDKINAELKSVGVKSMFYSSTTNPSTRFINGIVYALVAVIGGITIITGANILTIGMLVTFLSYATQYTKPFNEITGVVTELQSAIAAARRVFGLLDEADEPVCDTSLEYCDGCIEARDVNFSYSSDAPLIKNFNLSVTAGERVAIVGKTGCGKTTLINLLMRFYDVDSGQILISNQPINELNRQSYRAQFGMVLQETWLFCGSIRENIAFSNPSATMDEIITAAKNAHIHNFIMRLPRGYDTVIGENGEGISQGQQQLLCIARVMLTKPPILILDEATSNIDTRTERKIQSAFALMMKGRTSFIIAHRLSTIVDADTILVMDNGNIIESGTHTSLLAQDGFYAKLYNSQFAK